MPSRVPTPSCEIGVSSFIFFSLVAAGATKYMRRPFRAPDLPQPRLAQVEVHVPGATHSRPGIRPLSYMAPVSILFTTSTCIDAMEHNIESVAAQANSPPARPALQPSSHPSVPHRRGVAPVAAPRTCGRMRYARSSEYCVRQVSRCRNCSGLLCYYAAHWINQ